ncbi:hypothetical protein CKAH01_19050 [Colletotrichum kahawae]|uniref:Uncharacterized protein n=1 Tax=Colletotrichum kahawae TaxID=34407 RepID=A0AAD9Y1X3_COLKA|nr:hypothetical protein CKAH01_19050 [Colletotrichum kahawae]
MDITWSKGINRRIKPSHVRKLQEVFMKGGLERSAPETICSSYAALRISAKPSRLGKTTRIAVTKASGNTYYSDVNPKSKNKPLLLKHLQAALANLSVYRDSTAYAENTAAQLQQHMLNLTIYNADAFQGQEVQTLTTENVTFINMADYSARFSHIS